jgi:hypothetical protein
VFPRLHLPQSGFFRKFADGVRMRKSAALTLLAAAVLVPACIVMLLKAGDARIWVEPVSAAVLTATLLVLIWEFYWKRSVAEEVFKRFHPPQVLANEQLLSPLTLFAYDEAKKICQIGPDAIQLSLVCAENSRIRLTQVEFSADGDFFEFVAEIRKNDEIVKAADKVRIAFDKIAGKLKHLEKGQIVSPILNALKDVPDFLEKLSGLMANVIVPLAHYLSSRDQARTLREINKKLDILFKFREIDQEAELKSIYLHAAQELSTRTPIYATERFDPHKRVLIRLRNVWAEEILLKLKTAPDVTNAWFRKRKEKAYCQHVMPCAVKLQLFQLAFFTDLCLAHATGSTKEFIAVVVKDDIGKFQQISDSFTRLQGLLTYKDEKEQPFYPYALAIQEGTVSFVSFLKSVQLPEAGAGTAKQIKGR